MEILIEQQDIQQRVKELAEEITSNHVNTGGYLPPVMICLLNGAFMFYTDLLRNIVIDTQCEFIRLKSYAGQDNSGGVEVIKGIELSLKGRDVYIVDDICDSGATILETLFMVNSHVPRSVHVVTLLKRKGGTALTDFCGFEIGDEWVYGYGLDDNGMKRSQESIWKKTDGISVNRIR